MAFNTDTFKTLIDNGTHEEAYQYVVGREVNLCNLYYLLDALITPSDGFYSFVRYAISMDPSACDRVTTHILPDRNAFYDITLPELLIEAFPHNLRLFELVVSHCNESTLGSRDAMGRTFLHQVIMRCKQNRGTPYTECIPWLNLLLLRGADVNAGLTTRKTMTPLSLVDGLSADAQAFMDYLLSRGAKSTSYTASVVVQKRYNCNEARLALATVLLKKRAVVNKDVIRYLILPRVWETRLDSIWVNAVGGGRGVKKTKTE